MHKKTLYGSPYGEHQQYSTSKRKNLVLAKAEKYLFFINFRLTEFSNPLYDGYYNLLGMLY